MDAQYARRLLATASGLALLTAFVELAVLAFKKFVLGKFLWVSPDVLWMAPAAYLIVFGVLALVALALAQMGLRRILTARVQVFVFTFVGFASLLLMYRGLHRLAVLLLAAGVAAQVSRLAAKRPERFALFITRASIVGLVATGVLAAGSFGWQRLSERLHLAGLPAASPGAPNVLLIILDTVRSASLSLQGYQQPTTPALERLAPDGVVFDAAFATSPWTLPTHGSLLTGRYPHELTADWWTPLDDAHRTLAEVLSDQGYVTAGFVANLAYATYEHGLARGFLKYQDYTLSLSQWALNFSLGRSITNNGLFRKLIANQDILNRRSAGEINEAFLDWASDQERPFFAFLNYYDAHDPYLPPDRFDGRFGPVSSSRRFAHYVNEAWLVDKKTLSAEELDVERAAYDGAIAYMDEEVGRLFEELRQAGTLDNTIVIVTSDHGEQFGEHGLVDHGNSLYMPVLHVPLVIVYGRQVPAGLRLSEPVSLRDVAATILDLAGAEGGLPGTSMGYLWHSAGSYVDSSPVVAEVTGDFGEEFEPIFKGDLKSLVAGRYHYILNGDGGQELYDYVADPSEQNDLAGLPELADSINRFRDRLDRLRSGNE